MRFEIFSALCHLVPLRPPWRLQDEDVDWGGGAARPMATTGTAADRRAELQYSPAVPAIQLGCDAPLPRPLNHAALLQRTLFAPTTAASIIRVYYCPAHKRLLPHGLGYVRRPPEAALQPGLVLTITWPVGRKKRSALRHSCAKGRPPLDGNLARVFEMKRRNALRLIAPYGPADRTLGLSHQSRSGIPKVRNPRTWDDPQTHARGRNSGARCGAGSSPGTPDFALWDARTYLMET